MQKSFEIEQGVPEIWGFKGLEMILLYETKKRKKYHCALEIDILNESLCAALIKTRWETYKNAGQTQKVLT